MRAFLPQGDSSSSCAWQTILSASSGPPPYQDEDITKIRPFACSLCPYRSRQRVHLDNHMRTHTGEKPYQCSKCNFRFSQRGNLQRHMKTHAPRFYCPLCNARFPSRPLLDKHFAYQRRTGTCPYHCPHCDNTTAVSEASLLEHIRTAHPGREAALCPPPPV